MLIKNHQVIKGYTKQSGFSYLLEKSIFNLHKERNVSPKEIQITHKISNSSKNSRISKLKSNLRKDKVLRIKNNYNFCNQGLQLTTTSEFGRMNFVTPHNKELTTQFNSISPFYTTKKFQSENFGNYSFPKININSNKTQLFDHIQFQSNLNPEKDILRIHHFDFKNIKLNWNHKIQIDRNKGIKPKNSNSINLNRTNYLGYKHDFNSTFTILKKNYLKSPNSNITSAVQKVENTDISPWINCEIKNDLY